MDTHLEKPKTATTLAMVVLAVSFPTFLSLLWHYLSGDPTIRPLGITREALIDSGDLEGLVIYANVAWDPTDTNYASDKSFAQALKNGFRAKGLDLSVKTHLSNQGSYVTYQVGPSTMGPFPASAAARGINAAVSAYRMNVPYKP